jgi:hypothetical protein
LSRRHPPQPWLATAAISLMFALLLFESNSIRAGDHDSATAPAKPEVLVKADTDLGEFSYTISEGACTIKWTLYASGINRGVLTHRASGKTPLLDQVALMESLLERILNDYPGPDSLRAFYWGRLAPDFTGCTDMSLRLALAAGQSPSWNRRSGKPFKGHPNHFVAVTAEQQRIHAELADLFHRHGRQLSVSDVEKVLVAKAATLPCYPALKTHGVQPDEKLPFDCQLWFAVKPAGADPASPRR